MTKGSAMKAADPHILTLNGGSSSIKFARFETGDSLRRVLEGEMFSALAEQKRIEP